MSGDFVRPGEKMLLFSSDAHGNTSLWCFDIEVLNLYRDHSAGPNDEKATNKTRTLQDNEGKEESAALADVNESKGTKNNPTSKETEKETQEPISLEQQSNSGLQPNAVFVNPFKKQISSHCYMTQPKHVLFIGDARGSICVYSMNLMRNRTIHKPIQILKCIHGREAVSSIRIIRNRNDDDDSSTKDNKDKYDDNEGHCRILSAGKDGKVVEYQLVADKTIITNPHLWTMGSAAQTLNALESSATTTPQEIPIGFDKSGHDINPNVSSSEWNNLAGANSKAYRTEFDLMALGEEGDSLTPTSKDVIEPIHKYTTVTISQISDIIINEQGEIIVTGFHSTYFMVWNIDQDYVIFRWNCGGGKRPYAFQLLSNPLTAQVKPSQRGLPPLKGWLFAYTNANINNAVGIYQLNLPSDVALGSLVRSYHPTDVHQVHWILSPYYLNLDIKLASEGPREYYQFDNRNNEYVENGMGFPSLDEEEHMLVTLKNRKLFERMLLASCGEDGLIHLLSVQDDQHDQHEEKKDEDGSKAEAKQETEPLAHASHRQNRSRKSVPDVETLTQKDTQARENNQETRELSDEESTLDSESKVWMDWQDMKFGRPFHQLPDHIRQSLKSGDNVRLVSGEVLQQPGGSHFPFKCFDVVKKHDGMNIDYINTIYPYNMHAICMQYVYICIICEGYLLFAAGAKEFLQAFEIIPSHDDGLKNVYWRALCFTGGDKAANKRQPTKNWTKPSTDPSSTSDEPTIKSPSKTMDVRIKSVVVIPSPKFEGKWLVITGNSIGTIRAYTFDEEKPEEFQFEGEDSTLHSESNNFIPILSLASTYSCNRRYYFPNIGLVLSNDEDKYSKEEVEAAKMIQHFITNFGRTPKEGLAQQSMHLDASESDKAMTPIRTSVFGSKDSKSNSNSNSSGGDHAASSSRTPRVRLQSKNVHRKVSMHQSFHSSHQTEDKEFVPSSSADPRIITNYQDLPPHLIFSGSTNGWIYVWFWEIDTHSIQFVEKFKTHLSGLNTISVSWIDPTFVPFTNNLKTKSNVQGKNDTNPLMKRRFILTSGGDDQSVGLIVADFKSTMAASIAARRRRQMTVVDSSGDGVRLAACGWAIELIREATIVCAHMSSVRGVCVLPIPFLFHEHTYQQQVQTHSTSPTTNSEPSSPNKESKPNQLEIRSLLNKPMEKILIITTGEDQRVRVWNFPFSSGKKRFTIDQFKKFITVFFFVCLIILCN
ncbi:hypothetical protein RFI_17061 [Reticulomyxa filosa]|uniref:Uncharacterized protein n=1 Tax=Reticulomyxa filosa TaxID=46433 RepID=X6N4B7_RETFI|nr:hypothetical protein RFI_17061 [Reticulomyxa filosa]|eukprot:ETO20157.1 hypothetical protein RFI_17061 [Reticulomyxa filosa]